MVNDSFNYFGDFVVLFQPDIVKNNFKKKRITGKSKNCSMLAKTVVIITLYSQLIIKVSG